MHADQAFLPRLGCPPRVKIEDFFLCGYGGIGRRAGFRVQCPRRAGSSPVIRTTSEWTTLHSKSPGRLTGASACRKTCFGNQARAGFLFENKKTGGKSSEMSGAFSRNLDRLPPSGAGWRPFHSYKNHKLCLWANLARALNRKRKHAHFNERDIRQQRRA